MSKGVGLELRQGRKQHSYNRLAQAFRNFDVSLIFRQDSIRDHICRVKRTKNFLFAVSSSKDKFKMKGKNLMLLFLIIAASATTVAPATTAAPTAAASIATAAPTTAAPIATAAPTAAAPIATAAPTTAAPIASAAPTTAAPIVPATSIAQTTSTRAPTARPTATVPSTTASTNPPSGDEGVLRLNFRLFRTFTEPLANQSSTEFKQLSQNVTMELNRVYGNAFGRRYRRSNVASFSRGPSFPRADTVQVETNLIFQNETVVPNATQAATVLRQAINNSTTFLDAVPGSINAENPNTPTTTTISATTSGAMATNKPQEVVTFLFPLILVIYSLSTDMKLPHF